MARFERIDSQISAHCLIRANHSRVPELNPLFCESHFGPIKVANRRFEVIRANRSNVMKSCNMGFFFCESILANRFARARFALRIAGPSKVANVALVRTRIVIALSRLYQ